MFSDRHPRRFEDILRNVRANLECELRKFNDEANQAPLLVSFLPIIAPSRFVNSLRKRVLLADPAGVPRPAPSLLAG